LNLCYTATYCSLNLVFILL